VLHPSVLVRTRKTAPIEAENSGTGPAAFTTSTGVKFTPKAYALEIPDSVHALIPTYSDGFITNVPPSLRPVEPVHVPSYTPAINRKKEAPLEPMLCKDSVSHTQLTWSRPGVRAAPRSLNPRSGRT
jgi:hypothetical protein